MNHAYLIIAHNDFTILEKLIQLIDDERNDIFIHIDKKVNNFDKEKMKLLVKKSEIYFVKNYDVKWGEYSLIEAELSLFESAYNMNKYRYFHLLSGSDMILKSQNWIHNFFEQNNGYEFIACSTNKHTNKLKVIDRFNKFKHIDRENIIKKIYLSLLNNKFNYNRFKYDFEVCFGSSWASITDEFVKYIIDNKTWIEKTFKYSHTCDEVYKQCLAINSKFKTKLYTNKENIFIDLEKDNVISFNLRYIDWSAGGAHPKTFILEDYDELIDSNCIFARKFSTEVDKKIIEKIYNTLKD